LYMIILNFRIIISLILVFMIGVAAVSFFLREKPVMKMVNLAFVYLLTVAFLMYLIIIKNSEDLLFPIFIIIFINFLLTFLTGVSILNNLINAKEKNGHN